MEGVNNSSNFLTKSKFSQMVEVTVRDKNMSYMDAVIYICEENKLEIEDCKKYLSNIVKDKIEVEAMKLNFLPSQNTLPID